MRCSRLIQLGGFLLAGLLAVPAPAEEGIDALFASLQRAPNPQEARKFEQAIWDIWNDTGDDTLNALYQQGRGLIGVGRLGEARNIFSELIDKAPDFAEGWNQRATVLFFLDEYEASLADIERTLALEPRHYGAIFGKALIFNAFGQYQQALQALHEMEQVNPHARGIARLRSQIEASMKSNGG